MITFKLTTDVPDDHKVVLTLPPSIPTGRAELTVTIAPATPAKNAVTDEKDRVAAVDEFLRLARASTFRSTGPYPTRDELHERH